MAADDRVRTAPRLGARVLTADDKELGTVKEAGSGCFKVDAPLTPDYWLGVDTIAGTDGDAVRLAVTSDRLVEERSDAPAHSGLHRHETLVI